jgi:hemerythrin superfamily protein
MAQKQRRGRTASRSTASRASARTKSTGATAKRSTKQTQARGRSAAKRTTPARGRSTAKRTAKRPARRTTSGTGLRGRTDAIALLKKDHREVEGLFSRYRTLGARATKTKREVVRTLVRELSIHAAMEEQFLYPRTAQLGRAGERETEHALDEHHEVKEILAELDGMDPDDERMDALVGRLMSSVSEHVEEEEKELFPAVQKSMSKDELVALGEIMRLGKKTAPTRPHPRAPSTPPGNMITGMAAAVVDRARDAGRAIADRVTDR